MARREVKIFTNLSDDRSKKDMDDEEKKFKKMVARMQDSANERGGYLRGRGALDTEDLLYLREMEDAEQDAERARIQAERRAFAQFRAAAAAKNEVTSLPVLGQTKDKGKPNARTQSQLPLKTFAVQPKKQKTEAKAYAQPDSSSNEPTSRASASEAAEPSQRPEMESATGDAAARSGEAEKAQQPSVLLGLASYDSDDEDNEKGSALEQQKQRTKAGD